MINAILCSTNTVEPWAASVDFDISGTTWTVGLNKNFTHYKNLQDTRNVVIVIKREDFEIITKGIATIKDTEVHDMASTTISLNWLRLVENGKVTDYTNTDEIEQIITQRFS